VFGLRAIQAEFGDCLIVEFGSEQERRFLLIDGGPPETYTNHLEPELVEIAAHGGRVDLAVLSHVDNDHVVGLAELLVQLREQRENAQAETVQVVELWHNSFARTVDLAGDISPRLRAMLAAAGPQTMGSTGIALLGIAEGDKLRRDALALGVPINREFPGDLICVDDAPAPVTLANLTLTVVGPTRGNLAELQREWHEWLDAHEDAVDDPFVAAMADRSVPNLSSIMLLAEADDKRLLLTGDGRMDHLLAGLDKAGALQPDGSLHVDVLKVAHHGSERNTTREFFRTVTADTYVLSANGRDGNPDLATLIWIVEAAKGDGRTVDIVVTNSTPSTIQLQREYQPDVYGYQLTTIPEGENSVSIGLSD
jgi:hypothetical protein